MQVMTTTALIICPELLEGGLTQDIYKLARQLDFYKIVLSLRIIGQDEPIIQKGSRTSRRQEASAERVQVLILPVNDPISTRTTYYLVVKVIY